MSAEVGFLDNVCSNYQDDDHKDLQIGFSNTEWPYIVIPSMAMGLNVFIIATHIRRRILIKK
jgi:hypothetical protein